MFEMICIFFAGAFFGAGVLIAVAIKHDNNKKA